MKKRCRCGHSYREHVVSNNLGGLRCIGCVQKIITTHRNMRVCKAWVRIE